MPKLAIAYFISGWIFITTSAVAQPQPGAPPAPVEEPLNPEPAAPSTVPGENAAPPNDAAPPLAPSEPPLAEPDSVPVVPPPSEPLAVDVAEVEAPKKKKEKKEKKYRRANILGDERYGRLEFGGRLFARAELAQRGSGDFSQDWLDLSVPSARIDLKYQAPASWLSLDLEFDIAGRRPQMKDAYVQARGRHLFARAGQFKLPVSVLAMESPWTLPTIGRGLIHDLLTDWLDFAGRRPGVIAGVRGRGGIKPRFTLGAFQGTIQDGTIGIGDRGVRLLEEEELDSLGYVARADIELGNAEIGAYFQYRVGSPTAAETDHYPTAGLDLFMEHVFESGGIRVWAEVLAGTSWYEQQDKVPDGDDAVFGAARVLLAYRFGGVEDEAFYIEPFGQFGLFEPDTDLGSDMAFEAMVGVNVGLWRRARIGLQGELTSAGDNFPNQANGGYMAGQSVERRALLLQAGVAF